MHVQATLQRREELGLRWQGGIDPFYRALWDAARVSENKELRLAAQTPDLDIVPPELHWMTQKLVAFAAMKDKSEEEVREMRKERSYPHANVLGEIQEQIKFTVQATSGALDTKDIVPFNKLLRIPFRGAELPVNDDAMDLDRR